MALVFAGHLLHSGIPTADASTSTLAAYYSSHTVQLFVSAVLIELAAGAVVVFAVALGDILRRDDEGSALLARVALMGAVLVAFAITLVAGFAFTLAHKPGHLSPAALQAVHTLFFNLSSPLDLGIAVFLVACGLAVLRSDQVPGWLGWAAVLIGVIALAPPPFGDIVGFLGLGVWMLAASWVVARAGDQVRVSPLTAASSRSTSSAVL